MEIKGNENWSTQGNKITREYTFPDFKNALDFVVQIGEISEKDNHHPEIFLSWGKVIVELFTHSVGKITEKDYRLSLKIDELYDRK